MVHRILSLPLLTAEIRDFRPFNASSLSTALGTDVAPSLLLPERCRLASGATRTPSATLKRSSGRVDASPAEMPSWVWRHDRAAACL